MDAPPLVRVICQGEPPALFDLDRPLELGRQQHEGEPLLVRSGADGTRLAIGRLDDPRLRGVGRRHLRLEPVGANRVRIVNLSPKNPVRLEDHTSLAPAEAAEVNLPCTLMLGPVCVAIEEGGALQTLAHATVAPSLEKGPAMAELRPLAALAPSVWEPVTGWLEAIVQVMQSAMATPAFFDAAARAAVQIVDLDYARVLLLEETWPPRMAAHAQTGRLETIDPPGPSRRVIQRMCDQRRTVFGTPQRDAPTGSLLGVESHVVAPLLSPQNTVIGALYGVRLVRAAEHRNPISQLDAKLFEVLAGAVAAGLARLEYQKREAAMRVQFEQFFTPQLSRQLALDPDLVRRGRDAEVTVLFCDIRGFSAVSERLGPARTVEWLSNVMETLSECVAAHDGVLVDYIGDELMAMWGAPQSQLDHALRACRAARDMLACLPELTRRWEDVLRAPVAMGIGINTGKARVGNTGSQRKFKYGPLGTSVNLASRVQGATKHLRADALLTAATQRKLDDALPTRRLASVRVQNIEEPVVLFELAPPTDDGRWQTLRSDYEAALTAFERQDFRGATRRCGNILADFPDDGPTLLLLSRAVAALLEPRATFDQHWTLPGK
jgi:adenylate cyclase